MDGEQDEKPVSFREALTIVAERTAQTDASLALCIVKLATLVVGALEAKQVVRRQTLRNALPMVMRPYSDVTLRLPYGEPPKLRKGRYRPR